ncbi:ThiF family adenylyltransferase [Candidatus Aalborgicola defluviihabitans]|uniref:tRNA threonylcarbamoyladenosine dehydratase n=1 Tax=Candidatus Aalborgicola defluviihabitans TaxID=3386187 RepID=UPI00390BA7A2|nr:tRNA threonylcarbamoyladenosine dehydratase [Burkholderiales bacterium]
MEAPASDSTDLARRFSGMDRLYGVSQARAIRRAHVAVIGIGGVGSWVAEALARSGVGQLTLIDMDHVAESNINRQVHALSTTLGMAKITAMQERIALINPACVVHCIDAFVDPDNWPAILPHGVDATIDACDQIKTKTAIAEWARRTKAVFISVGAAGGKRLAHKVDIADLSETTHDPLLAQLRYRLRKEHNAPREGKRIGVACVFSREAVKPADASCAVQGDHTLNCHGYGSSVAVTAAFGMCAAGWVLDKISSPS